MTRGLCLLLALVGLPKALLAHTPYLSDPFPCHIDGGRSMTFLHGDGFFASDPKAAVVLDQYGRLLAYHWVGLGSFPILTGTCAVWDTATQSALGFDSATARLGDVVVGQSKAARAARWEADPTFADGQAETYGFSPVAAPSRLGLLWAEFRHQGPVALLLGLGAALAAAGISGVALLPWRARRILSAAAAVFLLGGALVLCLLVAVLSMMSDLSTSLTALAIGGGVVTGAAMVFGLRKARRTAFPEG